MKPGGRYGQTARPMSCYYTYRPNCKYVRRILSILVHGVGYSPIAKPINFLVGGCTAVVYSHQNKRKFSRLHSTLWPSVLRIDFPKRLCRALVLSIDPSQERSYRLAALLFQNRFQYTITYILQVSPIGQ